MFKSKAVQKIEEERKFLRLYHEKEITALNIARVLGNGNGIGTNHLELKDVTQSLRKSLFLKHFSCHSSEEAVTLSEQAARSYISTEAQIATIRSQQEEHQKINRNWPGRNQSDYARLQQEWEKTNQDLSNNLKACYNRMNGDRVVKSLIEQHKQLMGVLIHNKHLTHIDLKHMHMGHKIGAKFLKNILLVNKVISYFNLAHNNLNVSGGEMTQALENYRSLKFLDMSSNTLTEEVVIQIAEALATNGNLEHLNLGNNSVQGADEALGKAVAANKGLKHLDIQYMPLTISELKESEPTDISDKAPEGSSSTEETGSVKANISAEETEAAEASASREIDPVIKYFNPLFQAVGTATNLVYLNISGCIQHQQHAEDALADMFAANASMIEINLSNNNLGSEAMAKIVIALGSNNTLKILHIANNNFNEEGGEVIEKLLDSNHVISTLNIANNNLGYGAMYAVAEALKRNSSLKEVQLGSNNLDEAGGLLLGKALEENTALVSLDVSGNNIGDVGATYIAQALLTNKNVKHLNLANNNIGKEGIKALCLEEDGEQIRIPIDNIVTLNLRGNPLHDAQSVEPLANAIKITKTLKKLDFGMNGRGSYSGGPQVIKVIVDAIAANSHINLTHLLISNNSMCDNGAKFLADALENNRSIAVLDISGNNLTQTGIGYIATLIEKNICITRLMIDGNNDGAASQGANLSNFGTVLLPAITKSSIIELTGIFDGLQINARVLYEISKNHDTLQENLRKLDSAEGESFDLKQLLILLKQLQGRTEHTAKAELSYCDMKSDDYYMHRIAEIFKEKHFDHRGIQHNASEAQAEGVEGESAVAEEDVYFNALVDSGVMGLFQQEPMVHEA